MPADATAPNRPTLGNWLAVIALGVIWGASFMSVTVALQGFGPLSIAAIRIALAAAALWLLALALRQPLPRAGTRAGRRIWLFALGLGFFSNALPFFLLSWAQQHVTSGFAGITMALVPLFTLVLAHHLLSGERMTPLKLAGLALGLVGVVVLISPGALQLGRGLVEPVAQLICVGAAGCYSIGSILTRRCPPVNLIAFSAAALLAAAVMIVPVALSVEGLPTQSPPMPALLAVLYLGLGPTALATLLLVQVIRTAGSTFLTQTNYHVPVWSVIFGTVFLHEALPGQFLLALGLILGGLALSRATRLRLRPAP
ncbi:MAG: DMT family transporter [Pararhodobacter sp.]